VVVYAVGPLSLGLSSIALSVEHRSVQSAAGPGNVRRTPCIPSRQQKIKNTGTRSASREAPASGAAALPEKEEESTYGLLSRDNVAPGAQDKEAPRGRPYRSGQ
jgi:hypothetical protein